MLAIMCVVGMVALPLGDNIKVSLQLLIVFIVGLTSASFIDGVIVMGLYLLLGLFMPIYAGFRAGVTPTFGFVISFVIIVIPLYFLNKLKIKNQFIRMGLACLVALIICYAIGTIFFGRKQSFLPAVSDGGEKPPQRSPGQSHVLRHEPRHKKKPDVPERFGRRSLRA